MFIYIKEENFIINIEKISHIEIVKEKNQKLYHIKFYENPSDPFSSYEIGNYINYETASNRIEKIFGLILEKQLFEKQKPGNT